MSTQSTTYRTVRVRAASALLSAVLLTALVAGCGSSKKDSTSSGTSTQKATETTATTAADATAETTAAEPSGPIDSCKLLTETDLNTVLKGSDSGTRQLSQCVWTDPEGTAARLAVEKASAGSAFDTSDGTALDGVGEQATINTAPGTVRIKTRAKGYDVTFSVDTGTGDIKPNQANAISLVKKVVDQLT